jgi:hypothetical protein
LLPRVRRGLLLRWVLLFIAAGSLELLLIDQLLVPNLLAGLRPLAALDGAPLFERLLGLALPSLYVWLLGFVVVFHLWLNILGELTRFADRCFYKGLCACAYVRCMWGMLAPHRHTQSTNLPSQSQRTPTQRPKPPSTAWWNAPSLDAFWRQWNMPVHGFLMRTLYFPLIRAGVNKCGAYMGGSGGVWWGEWVCCVWKRGDDYDESAFEEDKRSLKHTPHTKKPKSKQPKRWWALVVVFAWSAALHEALIGVPFRLAKGWAFWAMFAQIPLIILTSRLRARLQNDALGNACV